MILTFDLEANGLLDEADTMWCLVAKDYSTGEVYKFRPNQIEEGLDLLTQAQVIAGHNIIGYDVPLIKELYPEFHAKLPRLVDTLVCSRLIWPDIEERGLNPKNMPPKLTISHSLEAWGYRSGRGKPEHEDWSQFSEDMLHRCTEDVEITELLLKRIAKENYSKEAMTLEHDFAHIIHLQEQSGFCFDTVKAERLAKELGTKKEAIEDELRAIVPDKITLGKKPAMYHYPLERGYLSDESKTTLKRTVKIEFPEKTIKQIDDSIIGGQPKITFHPFNPGSTKQRVEHLTSKYGWTPTSFTDKGQAQCNEAILRDLEYQEAGAMADYMKVSKILSMVSSTDGKGSPWLSMVQPDGRIHGYVNPCGTPTGRCRHSKPNLGQISAVQKSDEGEVLWGFEGGYGSDCRELFTVPEGYKLLGADLSGIEARALAHFMAKFDGGAYVDLILNGDVHTFNQEQAGLPTRAIAKKLLYMVMYGAGDAKVAIDVGVTLEEATKMKSDLLNGIPALQQVIKELKAEMKKNKGWIRGLDGRKLWIRGEHAILNMLLQGAGAVIMKKATNLAHEKVIESGLVYDEDIFYSAHVHDEVEWAVKEDKAVMVGELVIEAMKEAGEYFNLRCPIAGDYNIGNNWQETH